MTAEERIATLRQVGYFAELDELTLAELAKAAKLRRYAAGHYLVSELESGGEVYVVARGRAQVSVEARRGERHVIGELGPGSAFGEMASLTGELRSASVTALTPVEVLVLSDEVFDRLRVWRPEVAMSIVRTMVERLVEAERTLSALLAAGGATRERVARTTPRSTLSLLYRELVVNHQKDLPFVALLSFVASLLAIRGIVSVTFAYDLWPRDVLRIAYVSGFGLVMLCACAAILTFRPRWRRFITAAFAVGVGLIVNELGITLAFDIYYRDSTTLDPNLAFDIERLYRRTEAIRAMVVVLALLIHAVYLQAFYRRVASLVRLRFKQLRRRKR